MSTPIVLDPASGSRMMYFDKADDRVLFGDIRTEQHTLCDGRALNIEPDMEMDFRSLPFDDGAFRRPRSRLIEFLEKSSCVAHNVCYA